MMLQEHIQSFLAILMVLMFGQVTTEPVLSINITVTTKVHQIIKFNEVELNGFYSCLCKANVTQCDANLQQSTVRDIVYYSHEMSEQFSTVFNCELKSPLFNTVECYRQPMASCNCTTDCFIYSVNDKDCFNGQVAVKWSRNITGRFDNKTMSINKSDNSLCTIRTTTPGFPNPPPDTSNTEAPSFLQREIPEMKSESFHGNTESPNEDGASSENNIGIIVGVLFGIVAVAAIVAVAVFIWKRNLLEKLPKLRILVSRLHRGTTRNAEINHPQYEDGCEYNDVDYQVTNKVVIKENNNSVIKMLPNDELEYWSDQPVNDNAIVNPAFVVDSNSETYEAEVYENIQFNNKGSEDGLIYEDGVEDVVTAKSNEISGDDDLNYDAVYETSADVSTNRTRNCLDASAHDKISESLLQKEYANFANIYAKLNKQELPPDGDGNEIMDNYEDVDLQTTGNKELSQSLALALSERSLKNKAQSMVEVIQIPAKRTTSEVNETSPNQPATISSLTNNDCISSVGVTSLDEPQETSVHEYNNSPAMSSSVQETPNLYFELEKNTEMYDLANHGNDLIDEGSEEEFDYFSHSNV